MAQPPPPPPPPQPSVLITGCSPGGIGHALAREFHARGFRVFATARRRETIADLAALGCETVSLEATSAADVAAARDEVAARTGGRLDVLVNNAGRNYTVPALDVDLDEVRATFETNVVAVVAMCQAFAPLLMRSSSSSSSSSSKKKKKGGAGVGGGGGGGEGGGTIVQIGSLAAVMPYVFGSVYNASKAALHSYSDTLRVELAPFGVRVVTVVTGGVRSNIARTRRDLPSDSIYLPLAAEYGRRQTHSQANAIPNEQYARSVVGQLLASPSRDTIWEGGKSWLVWFASSFLPRWVMDVYMARSFNLWKLERMDLKKAA